MWRILQHDVADDFVLATGEMHSVREFCELAFQNIGVTIKYVLALRARAPGTARARGAGTWVGDVGRRMRTGRARGSARAAGVSTDTTQRQPRSSSPNPT